MKKIADCYKEAD